MVDWLKSR